MFLCILIHLIFIHFKFSLSSSTNTYIFSARPNSYVAFDSWRPCLTGYIRFDIRTSAQDGTLAYIDDRGKFDFIYLKLIEGKPRLLFNLGNDRQALNVNMKINDDQWHTITIKRNGQVTILSIDNGLVQNSTITHAEDLYFGGELYNEYQASPFYFGGIPSVLERPSSGNLSSFDVYMQPGFRGQLRNIIYKNCTNTRLIQPVPTDISNGVSVIPNHYCSQTTCGLGICLTDENSYKCLCDDIHNQGAHCQNERKPSELTFNGKHYLRHDLNQLIPSFDELITFEFKTNYDNGLLFQLIETHINIKLKQGQLLIEYRSNNNTWYESSTKNLHLVDNRWHYVQIKRKHGQIIIIIDQNYFDFESDHRIEPFFNITQIFIGGSNDLNMERFYGCLREISLIFNENVTIDINQSILNPKEFELNKKINCKSLIEPVQFLGSSSFISFNLPEFSQELNISFRFGTYSPNCVLLYAQSNHDFLGFDLIDGFFFITFNIHKKRQRQELFQQRFNDGQLHHIQIELRTTSIGLEINVMIDYRQNTRTSIRTVPAKLSLQTLTVGGINPSLRWLPTNYFAGLMRRGLVGCFSHLEINTELIDLEKYINRTNSNIAIKSGSCTSLVPIKRECSCEHNGECRQSNSGIWSCDCSKTGYTGQRCEQLAYQLDLSQIQLFELNTNVQWSEHITEISFRLQATHDEDDFLQIRPCALSLKCDSVSFSIRNGLLNIHFYLLNLTVEYPFILDHQWHSIYLQHIDTNFLLHIDNHIIQQRVNIINVNLSSLSTVWLIFHSYKQVRIEDLRLYDQSIYVNFFLDHQYKQMKLTNRPWKPQNTISFENPSRSYVEIPLTDVLCHECPLHTIYFQFRTSDSNGLLLLAHIQPKYPKVNVQLTDSFNRTNRFLLLKLVKGELYLIIFEPLSSESSDEVYHLPTRTLLNDNHWHHVFLYRASDHHLELVIDSHEYYLITSIYFTDKLYFGRSPSMYHLNDAPTIRGCIASLSINGHSKNLREFIKLNSPVRNDCFLDSQCPLKPCQNMGVCFDRIQCNCQHTSFNGRFCTNLKLGYSFNEYTSGLIFDQPFIPEKTFSTYIISFGIVTKIQKGEVIRINDQILIEINNGCIRVKLIGNEFVHHDHVINDGNYHLIRIQYNKTGHLSITVDNKPLKKQLKNKIIFDRPLLLLIGQNPAFKHPFQGQLYGLQSDSYSVFDLILPTFHRISYTPIRNKSISSPSFLSSIIYPSSQIEDDFIHPSCSYQPYDDICMITSDTNSSPLLFPNIVFDSSLSSLMSTRISSRTTVKSSMKSVQTSTSAYQQSLNYLTNSTDFRDHPTIIVSISTTDPNQVEEKVHWSNTWLLIIPVLAGILVCMALVLCACMKYRRRDAGVYELEETQRFRPLVVELPSSPGENNQEIISSTNNVLQKINKKSHRGLKRKGSLLLRTDEQREFYI